MHSLLNEIDFKTYYEIRNFSDILKMKTMSLNYRLSINNEIDLNLSEIDVDHLDVITAEAAKYHVLLNNISYDAEIISNNFNKRIYKVKVNTNTYNINIFNPLDLVIKELGFEVGTSKQIDKIKAPMPGLILDIHVKVGQEVKENDPLLILEAMKMENVIISPRAGVIKSVAVEKGNAVDKNQLLVEFA